MLLSPMRFKSFVWPHNPQTYAITFERNMAVHKVPFGRYYLQSLGQTRRVLRGEGEFVGEGAYDTFKRLANVFYEETPGMLIHPVWMTSVAWFVHLEVLQEPRPDYVRYSFEFWDVVTTVTASLEQTALQEGGTGGSGEAAAPAEQIWHTVARGETIWGLSVQYGVTVEDIVGLNPSIRNPNLIYPGQRVRVT